MLPLAPLPDDELALIQYLRGVPQLTALVPPDRITTILPANPVYPVILINRALGVTVAPGLDEAVIQVDVVGGSKTVCKQVAQMVRAVILAIFNDTVAAGVLASAFEETGPTWLPDTVPTPPLSRYVNRFRLLLHK